ncbi:DMT family transporter [Roseinatronobacter alkalisoli]|uniref:DMT family transporter n=1 Tax=Roseinatronobacter alkalisoli TaxID=3028235 RepID=A0ABT5TAP2_9RHOB|nr:DMT family transporter [Roseinatronobacter sp. HJB301]MDD7972144.1 DMT family transporter [Roseinatronobacter sp. HJB301]
MKDDNTRAAVFMLVGSSAFAVNDTFLKLLGTDLSAFQILAMRGAIVTCLFGLLVWHSRITFAQLNGRDRRLLLIRSASEALAAYFFFNALFNMPLANVTAIIQVVPLAVALAAWLFLREPLGWRRLSAILVGFCGVLLIVRPGGADFGAPSVFALLTVAMVTFRDLSTRVMAKNVPSSLVAFTTALGVTLFGLAGAVTETWVVPSPVAWVWLSGTVIFSFIGYYLIVLAMRTGELTFVAPFRYGALLSALVLGWFVLGEWPDTLTFVGGAIIVVTGVYTLYRERRYKLRMAAATSTNDA